MFVNPESGGNLASTYTNLEVKLKLSLDADYLNLLLTVILLKTYYLFK
jgi:hypothetical protein